MATKSTTETVESLDPKKMSKEQLGEKRKEITEYYEGNIPHLETQLKYEQLLRDIEKTRAERLQAQMFIAQTMAPAPEAEGEPKMGPNVKSMTPANAAEKGLEVANQIKKTLKRQSNEV
jgi:hypothetical protein